MLGVYTVEGKVSDDNGSLMWIITPTSPISSLRRKKKQPKLQKRLYKKLRILLK